jgi:hypothetical protein
MNRHHATVLNSIKAHHELKKDKVYLDTIEETKQFFDRIKFDEEIIKRDLYKDVQCATSLYSLNRIKDYMNKGAYDYYRQQTEQL